VKLNQLLFSNFSQILDAHLEFERIIPKIVVRQFNHYQFPITTINLLQVCFIFVRDE